MHKDGDLQCNFLNSKILLDYWHQLLCQKSGFELFRGTLKWIRHFSVHLFTDKKFQKEGISAVVMILHLEGKLFFFFVR